jgi:hypothetical protein
MQATSAVTVMADGSGLIQPQQVVGVGNARGYHEHVADRFDSRHIARDRRVVLLRRLHL